MTTDQLSQLKHYAESETSTGIIAAAMNLNHVTVLKYLRILGYDRRAKRIDHSAVDKLLHKGERVEDVAERVGCSVTVAKRRKAALGLTRPCQHVKRIHETPEQYAPFIPFPEREKSALEATRKRLGMDEYHFAVWMQGKVWTAERGIVAR